MIETHLSAATDHALLPCPFCGGEDIELWTGFGTQADIGCQSCACERSVQVADMRASDRRREMSLPSMTRAEATAISGRSESWLKQHTCSWCDQTLWRALRYGCGAIYEKCDPTKKDFSPAGHTRCKADRSYGTLELASDQRGTE